MTNAPLVTAVIPWTHVLVKQTQQRLASRKSAGIRVGGSLRGWEITATPQQFLDLGLAQESGELSLPLVSRLRQAGFRVEGSRTVHLPGGTGVVEVQIDQAPDVVGRVLGCLERSDGADVVTVYDRAGVGHTRVLGAVKTVPAPVKETAAKPVRSKRWAAKESALVNAIRQIWEDKAEEFTRNVAWDSEDYEAYTVQELVSGLLPEFLTDDQLKQWYSLEAEAQTEVLNQAFPEDKIRDTVNRVDRSFWDRQRGASRTIFAEEVQRPQEEVQRPQEEVQRPQEEVQSEVDWSQVPDSQEQLEEAMRVLLVDEPGPLTAARKKKPVKINLSRRETIEEVATYRQRLEEREAQLAEMKRTKVDPELIKKQEKLIKRTKSDLKRMLGRRRPKDWHSIAGLTRAATAFLEKMGGDEVYVDWYERHRSEVDRIYGPDEKWGWGGGPNLFYGLLAASSPRNKVNNNLKQTMIAYKAQKDAHFAGDKSFVHTKKTSPKLMRTHLPNMNRALRGEPLSGLKVSAFLEALTGDERAVVIDMWMSYLLFGHHEPSDDEILYAQKVVTRIAANMGKPPRFTQGLLWEMVMSEWKQPPADFLRALKRQLALRGSKQQSVPTASRRASVSLDDDPNEVAKVVMKMLGLSPAATGGGRVDPMDLGVGEEPALSRASRIFD